MRSERLKGSGRFIHPLAVEENTGTTTDNNGKIVPDWTIFAEPFGRVTYMSGDDAIVINQRIPTATHKIEMYEVTGINEKMRVRFNNRVLHIREISDPNAGEISLVCEEAK